MLDKLEKKFGKYAIPGLIKYIVACYIIGFVLLYMPSSNGSLLSLLTLEPYYIIFKGQIWRLVSWILIPPQEHVLFIAITAYLYYQLGTVLEQTWGTFKFNVYVLGGILFTIIGAFILYGIAFAVVGSPVLYVGGGFSTFYINMSIFLAFSVCYPDEKIYLYFIIPLKMKWMGIVYALMLGYEVIRALVTHQLAVVVVIVSSLLNFLIFFFAIGKNVIRRNSFSQSAAKKRTTYRANTNTVNRTGGQPIVRHRCCECGRTDLTNPELDFRFCSKCQGNFEYCSDHIFTHKHKQI